MKGLDVMNDITNEKLLISPVEAAKLIGVGRTTIYAWIKEGIVTATAFTFIQWKTTGFRRKPCDGIISGDRLVRVCTLLGIRKTCR